MRRVTTSISVSTAGSGSSIAMRWKSLSAPRGAGSGIRPALIRWAFTTIRLSAACRNTSVSRATGTAPEAITSASTCPGPTEGNWSTSPTSSSAACSGTALVRAFISGTSTIEVSSMTRRSQGRGFSALREKPPCLGSISSSRWIVLASSPVCSLMRLAARPVGAASSTRTPFARRIRRIVSRVEVLPTPGPPVTTASLAPSTRRTASSCEGESVLPVFSVDPGQGPGEVDLGPGRRAGRPPEQPLGDGALGGVQACEEDAGLVADDVLHDLAGLQNLEQRRADQGRLHAQQLPRQLDELRHRQGAVAPVGGGLQREGDPGPQALRGLRGQPELHRDRVGGLEADAADVACASR